MNLRYSPQTAWTLYKALEKQIERYEEMNGEIAQSRLAIPKWAKSNPGDSHWGMKVIDAIF